jgi:RNA polymerase sigma-70 factor (ECF subfamily)
MDVGVLRRSAVRLMPVRTATMLEPIDSGSPELDLAREERFLRLLLAHQRRIFAYVLALVPHWSDAEDVVQETSAVLWRKFDDFEPGTDFAAWALSVARYQVLNFRKKQRRGPGRLSDQTVEALAERLLAVERQADARLTALENCLQKLSSKDRDLVQLRAISPTPPRRPSPAAWDGRCGPFTGAQPHP